VQQRVHAAQVRNGIVDSGEDCDDNNLVATDDCTNACKFARCGDGIVRLTSKNPIPAEECDDGNASNSDDCLTTCKKASCGDGFIGRGVRRAPRIVRRRLRAARVGARTGPRRARGATARAARRA